MSKFIVVLTNASYGVTVGTVAVCGNSGKRYGHSTYSDKWRCHAIEMSLAEYEVACDDLSRGWHKALCKWVPHFVEVHENVITPENNGELRRICMESARKLSAEDFAVIARDHGLIVTVVPIEQPLTFSNAPIPSIGDPVISELPTKYLSLCKLARDEGIDISALPRTGEAVRAAILAHRQQKAA